jgi:hypothetical protein
MMPQSFVDALATRLTAMFPSPVDAAPDFAGWVRTYPVDSLSPDGTVAVWPTTWEADEESKMIGAGDEPTRHQHSLTIQCLVLSADQMDGYSRYTLAMRKVRAMLYRDVPLRVALQAMTEVYLGTTERFVMLEVQRQRHMPARFDQFLFLGHTDLRITTDVIRSQ